MILCNCLYCDYCQNHVKVLTTESIFSESAPQIKALDRNLSAFSTLLAPGKSWDNVRSTTAPYTESRLTDSVANERVGFPVVEQSKLFCTLRIAVSGRSSSEELRPSTVTSPGDPHHLHHRTSFAPLHQVLAPAQPS